MNTIVVSTTTAYAVLIVVGALLVTIGFLAVQISKWSTGFSEATRRLADEEFSHAQTREQLQSVMRFAETRFMEWAEKVKDRDSKLSAALVENESLKIRLEARDKERAEMERTLQAASEAYSQTKIQLESTSKKVPVRGKNGKFVKRSTL